MTGELNIGNRDDEVSEAEMRENGHTRGLREELEGDMAEQLKGCRFGLPWPYFYLQYDSIRLRSKLEGINGTFWVPWM
jgi:hypothetical protein